MSEPVEEEVRVHQRSLVEKARLSLMLASLRLVLVG